MVVSKFKRWVSGAMVGLMIASPGVSLACTSFLLPGSDGGFVYGRTLEFGIDIKSRGIAVPRNQAMQGTGIDGTAGSGLKWTTKYAAFGASALGLPIIVDGMNEKAWPVACFICLASLNTKKSAQPNQPIPLRLTKCWFMP